MPLEFVFHLENVYFVVLVADRELLLQVPPLAFSVTVYDPAEALALVGLVVLIVVSVPWVL